MSVNQIAYDRNYEHLINPMYYKAVESVELMKDYENLSPFHVKNFNWKWIYDITGNIAFDTSKFCERYFAQMALQLERRDYDSYAIMGRLTSSDYLIGNQNLIKFIRTLPLETKMDFVDTAKENYIRKEWKDDKVGFLTFLEMYDKKEIIRPEQKTLFGYDSEYSEHFEALEEFESKGDIIDCESISLHDKMRFFDEW